VHRPLDSDVWEEATRYEPNLPKKIVNKGYAVYKIEYKGYEFTFSSIAEINHCVSVFENKILPTTYELASNSWMKNFQHVHWLSTWLGKLKSFNHRQAIIKLLNKVKNETT
ncbi:MAG: hypothetical protein JKY67_18530, partial [Pseudomonadales bacterium]|nr:hypothetical protein [Pseudomonadales bacterium]